MERQEIDFIARHYRKGRFAVGAAWHRVRMVVPFRRRRLRIAVAVSGVVILSATAAFWYHEYKYTHGVSGSPAEVQQTMPVATVASPMAVVRVIDFEDASLPEVVRRIEEVYGVKVANMPANPASYKLSLHYEGTPVELISVINDILGTQMTVDEQ